MNTITPWMPVAVVLAGLVAGVVFWALTKLPLRPLSPTEAPQTEPLRFLLSDGRVIDHNAVTSCNFSPDQSNWSDLRQWFGDRFPNLPEQLPVLEHGQTHKVSAMLRSDCAVVQITGLRRGNLRIELLEPAPLPAAEQHVLALGRMTGPMWRQALDAAPCGICILDAEGNPSWSNCLFNDFSESDADQILEVAATSEGHDQTMVLTDPDTGKARHFSVRADRTGDHGVLYITEVTQLIEADTMRSSFIQTLTKTFADLTTGLVVFDRQQRLVLFNPAIIDLTHLSAEFLSIRPGVMEFFDRLRDNRVLPEPKNYASWRAQIGDVIETAVDGHYVEAWTLPNGLTYRVTGRPHPDGAIAFLFEDITDEVSTTRRSRTQLEIRQAALDHIQDAVAVAGPNGLFVFCNRAFRDILGFAPDSSFAETGFDDLVALCRDRFPDAAFWDNVAKTQGRRRIETELAHGPEGPAVGRVQPLTGGFTMLHLSPRPVPEVVSA